MYFTEISVSNLQHTVCLCPSGDKNVPVSWDYTAKNEYLDKLKGQKVLIVLSRWI